MRYDGEMSLSSRQRQFTLEYLQDLNATRAAARAGYRHPNVQGSQLLAKAAVRANIDKELTARSARLKRDADWVIEKLEQEATDRNNPAHARIRALELIGKHLGVFSPKRFETRFSGTLFADITE